MLLNHVIQSIPPNSSIWLTLLDQKGDNIHITGYTLRSESIPDFMSNLAATNFFKSVDLELMEDTKEAAKFSLVCMGATKLSTD
jgi:Tfp pilus assembly protein PilN